MFLVVGLYTIVALCLLRVDLAVVNCRALVYCIFCCAAMCCCCIGLRLFRSLVSMCCCANIDSSSCFSWQRCRVFLRSFCGAAIVFRGLCEDEFGLVIRVVITLLLRGIYSRSRFCLWSASQKFGHLCFSLFVAEVFFHLNCFMPRSSRLDLRA